ncbi:hypothetical protein D3C86_1897070 [compost metagenome]
MGERATWAMAARAPMRLADWLCFQARHSPSSSAQVADTEVRPVPTAAVDEVAVIAVVIAMTVPAVAAARRFEMQRMISLPQAVVADRRGRRQRILAAATR